MPPARFTKFLGMSIEGRKRGTVTVTLPLAANHRNKRGVAHGGVTAALLDTALGAAVVASIPKAWWCATTSLSVMFIAGARGGTLTATGRVLRRGRSTAFASGEVRGEDGALVATAQGTWHLWPHHPDAPRPDLSARKHRAK